MDHEYIATEVASEHDPADALAMARDAVASGLWHDAVAMFDRALAHDPAVDTVAEALRFALRVDAHRQVLEWSAVGHRLAPANFHFLAVHARALAQAGRESEAAALIQAAVDGPTVSARMRLNAAETLLRCRAFDQAQALYAECTRDDAVAGDAHAGLASLHMWKLEWAPALEHATTAIRLGRTDAARVVAASEIAAGEPGRALVTLQAATADRGDDAEIAALRAEALLAAGRGEECLAEAARAGDLSPEAHMFAPAVLLTELARLRLRRYGHATSALLNVLHAVLGDDATVTRQVVRRPWGWPSWLRRLVSRPRDRGLTRVVGAPEAQVHRAVFVSRRAGDTFERALRALGGNRTPSFPTKLVEGRLVPLHVPSSPRHQAKTLLHSVRFRPVDEVEAEFTQLQAALPEWPQPWYYRAELRMWLDRWDAARDDLDVAFSIHRESEGGLWPRVGLAACHLHEGSANAALEVLRTIEQGSNGSLSGPFHAWMGEVLYALGRLDEARAHLSHVCGPGPMRVGSWLTLALVEHDAGADEQLRGVAAVVARAAPALLAAAGLSTGQPLPSSPDALRGLLATARHLMRGNRTAGCVTFLDDQGRLRFIEPSFESR